MVPLSCCNTGEKQIYPLFILNTLDSGFHQIKNGNDRKFLNDSISNLSLHDMKPTKIYLWGLLDMTST
jgi:hypothetical protein